MYCKATVGEAGSTTTGKMHKNTNATTISGCGHSRSNTHAACAVGSKQAWGAMMGISANVLMPTHAYPRHTPACIRTQITSHWAAYMSCVNYSSDLYHGMYACMYAQSRSPIHLDIDVCIVRGVDLKQSDRWPPVLMQHAAPHSHATQPSARASQ